jgi:drug/metabolite transporter (DMT)-like permease
MFERPTDNVALGIMAGMLSAAGFGLVSIAIHQASVTLPAAEITFGRAAIGLAALLPLVWRKPSALPHRQAGYLWLCASAGAVSIVCFAWNLQHTSVGVANILFNLSILLILVSGSVVGETTFSVRAAIELGLVLLGTSIYWHGEEAQLTMAVAAVGLLGAVAATIAFTALKKAARAADSWRILCAVCAASVPVSLFAGTTDWAIPSGTGLLTLLAVGLGSLASQWFLVLSFVRLPLTLATALTPSCIVWSVIGATFFNDAPLSYDGIIGVSFYAIGICALAARTSAETVLTGR